MKSCPWTTGFTSNLGHEMVELDGVGFVGIGRIGTPMVQRLLECGQRVVIWNRSLEKCDPLVTDGAIVAPDLEFVARNCRQICLCLADTEAVEQVVFGLDGLARFLSKGQLVIDFSSISPIATRRMEQQLLGSDVLWLDAPVSGGLPAARAGTLTVFAGGTQDALDAASVVLSCLATRVTHMGGSGAGQLAKTCNQMIVASQVAVIAEMLGFAHKAGVDVRQLPRAMEGGFADSKPLQIFGNRMAIWQTQPSVGAMKVMLKDIQQAADLAADAGGSTPVVNAALSVFQRAVADTGIGPDADLCSLIDLYAKK